MGRSARFRILQKLTSNRFQRVPGAAVLRKPCYKDGLADAVAKVAA